MDLGVEIKDDGIQRTGKGIRAGDKDGRKRTA